MNRNYSKTEKDVFCPMDKDGPFSTVRIHTSCAECQVSNPMTLRLCRVCVCMLTTELCNTSHTSTCHPWS